MCSRCWEISSPYTDTSTGRSICLNCAYHAVGQALRGAKNLKGQILGVSGNIVYITTHRKEIANGHNAVTATSVRSARSYKRCSPLLVRLLANDRP